MRALRVREPQEPLEEAERFNNPLTNPYFKTCNVAVHQPLTAEELPDESMASRVGLMRLMLLQGKPFNEFDGI